MRKMVFILILSFAFLSILGGANGGAIWSWSAPGDACLSLATLPDISGDGRPEVVAGMDSGRIVCLSTEPTSPPLTLWAANLKGSVLALLPVSGIDDVTTPDLIASSDLGEVVRLRTGGRSAGTTVWSFRAPGGINALAAIPDRTGDGVDEIAFGGGDQRVYLRNGATGAELWTRALGAISGGSGYVHGIVNGNDLNGDGVADVVARTWEDAKIWAFDGANGNTLWTAVVAGYYTDPLAAAGDLTGDGLSEFLTGGNDKYMRLCSGAKGAVLWAYLFQRPLRTVLVPGDVNGDGISDCIGATAGGEIACISGAATGSPSPIWTATVDGVCRTLISPGDLDNDGKPDISVSTEEGLVVTLSGADGLELWRWQGIDVARPLTSLGDVNNDGKGDLAVGCLDGTVSLLSGDKDVYKTKTSTRKTPKIQSSNPKILKSSNRISGASDVPILLYHDVQPEMYYTYGVSTDNFRAQMDLLVSGGYTSVSLDQIADWIEGKAELPDRPVCITFDGPYAGQYKYAYPILKKRGFSATVFCTTDWIGTANHTDWHQMRRMDSSGIQNIQNHTINHVNLTTLSNSQVVEQVTLSNESIKRRMNGKIALHHAYPGGAYNDAVMEDLRSLGFRTAVTVVQQHVKQTDDLMELPRYSVVKTTTLAQFRTKIRYMEPTPTPTPTPTPVESLPYQFVRTVGADLNQPSYGDVDAQGRLWVCDSIGRCIRVFEKNGTEAAFSPITQGLDQNGRTVEIEAPSGITITPSGEAVVSIADYFGAVQYLGLLRYRASDGAHLNGLDLTYKPGDLDCDAQGLLFVTDQFSDYWHVYTPAGVEISGSPAGSGAQCHFLRGIGVRSDSTRIYVFSETDGAVHVWTGFADESGAHYSEADDLVSELSGVGGAVEVLDNGTILISDEGGDQILAYDAEHRLLGNLTGGTPNLEMPGGVAFTPDASTIWIMSQSGYIQRWDRINHAQGWMTY
jgi:peptidoglycan/xylan/chitin deacetylase (PgdA/CDA1 family)